MPETSPSTYQPEEETITIPESVKNRAELKANILKAISAKDSDRLVVAMQELRRHVLTTSEMDPQRFDKEAIDSKDSLHVDDGSWRTQFDRYFEHPQQTEVYFNGVTRLMIESDGGLGISGVSSQEAKTQWRLIEDAYDFVYGE